MLGKVVGHISLLILIFTVLSNGTYDTVVT
jgi:hypothetical protein